MQFLTDFGDTAVLLPLSIVVLAWLLTVPSRGPAIWWVAALGIFGGVVGALKAVFFACPPAPDIISPSGHTGFSLLVYGGVAVIVAGKRRSIWVRAAAIALAVGLAAGIGLSRVALGMHTMPEIVIGYAIGAVALLIFGMAYLRSKGSGRTIAPLLAGAALVLAAFHGGQINEEDNLHALGTWLDLRGAICR